MVTRFRPLAAVLGIVVALFLLTGIGWGQTARPGGFLETPGRIEAALEAFRKKHGPLGRLHGMAIENDSITLRLEGPSEMDIDAVRIRIARFLGVETLVVGDREPTEPDHPVDDIAGGLFDTAEVRLTDAFAIGLRAIAEAPMDSPPHVVSIELKRDYELYGPISFADVEWRVNLSNERESASVTFDSGGRVKSKNLEDTNPYRRRDFLAGSDFPVDEAAQALAAAVGPQAVVLRVLVRQRELVVTSLSPEIPDRVVRHSWRPGEPVFRWTEASDLIVENALDLLPRGAPEPFSIAEVDFSRLGPVLAAAREALIVADPGIENVVVIKRTGRSGGTELEWEVSARLPVPSDAPLDGGSVDSSAMVVLDDAAMVRRTKLPAWLAPPEDHLSPDAAARILAALAPGFGADASLDRVTIEAARVTVDALGEDGLVSWWVWTGARFERTIELFIPATLPFRAGDVPVVEAGRIAAMQEETLRILQRPGASIGQMQLRMARVNGERMLLLVIGLETGPADGEAWVAFDLDGRVMGASGG